MTGLRPDLDVVEVTGTDPNGICAVMREGYGEERFTPDWFAWKHRQGPWGPSRVFVGRVGGETLGVVCCLPWRYRGPSRARSGMRFVDGASLPAARGRGVFGRTVAGALRVWSEAQGDDLVVATATPDALRSHVRNGAVAVPPIRPAYVAVRAGPARIESSPDIVEEATPGWGWATDWDGLSLRWRFDPRSGHTSSFDRLVQADEPTGAITRTVRRWGAIVVVVEVAWGSMGARRALLRSIARRERAVALLGLHGVGADGLPGRAVVRRPPTLLAVWDRRGEGDGLARREPWALTLADVGGPI